MSKTNLMMNINSKLCIFPNLIKFYSHNVKKFEDFIKKIIKYTRAYNSVRKTRVSFTKDSSVVVNHK